VILLLDGRQALSRAHVGGMPADFFVLEGTPPHSTTDDALRRRIRALFSDPRELGHPPSAAIQVFLILEQMWI
jgi:hypothetical protein